MKLKIKILNEAVREHYENWSQHHEGDSGVDLPIPFNISVQPGDTAKMGLGIACEPDSPYFIFPRSSISKTPLRLANGTGIIDKGYRGELMAMFDNIKPKTHHIKAGDRYLQICAPDLSKVEIEIVEELSETTRGTDGIGSTGR